MEPSSPGICHKPPVLVQDRRRVRRAADWPAAAAGMEEQLSPLAVTHLLQHTLRSLCAHDDAQWVYAVFWRILPRNYPPPKGVLLELRLAVVVVDLPRASMRSIRAWFLVLVVVLDERGI